MKVPDRGRAPLAQRMLAAISIVVCASLLGCAAERSTPGAPEPVRNVVLMIGDGMGTAIVTASRIVRGRSKGIEPPESAQLFIDTLPYSAFVRTYSADRRVSDSAAAMTAMVTGRKTNNRVVSMDAATDWKDARQDGDGLPLRTFLEIAESRGMATGVVTTTNVTHATPACCYAHHNDRDRQQEIADQLLDNPALGDGIEVILGGGRERFIPIRDASGERMFDEQGLRGQRTDHVDLRQRFRDAGYTYVHGRDQLLDLPPSTEKVLGLFAADHMSYESDRLEASVPEPSLTEMTLAALAILKRHPGGFFLMVEGGRIDHALHENRAMQSAVDLLAFDDAVRALVEAVDLEETLVLVTGDHDHTMVIAGDPPVGSPLEVTGGTSRQGLAYPSILFGTGPGYRDQPQAYDAAAGAAVDYRFPAAVSMKSAAHGGMDVPLYAIGAEPYASRVRGSVDNTAIFDRMMEAMEGR